MIKTTQEAVEYLEKHVVDYVSDISGAKWQIVVNETEGVMFCTDTDEELIEYANEQKDAIEN